MWARVLSRSPNEKSLTKSQTKTLVEKAGGSAISGKEAEGESGSYMQFRDVAGNIFGAYELNA